MSLAMNCDTKQIPVLVLMDYRDAAHALRYTRAYRVEKRRTGLPAINGPGGSTITNPVLRVVSSFFEVDAAV